MGNYSECVIGVCDKDMRYLELHKDTLMWMDTQVIC